MNNYVLYATEECNLKCTYCEHKSIKKHMQLDTYNTILAEAIADTRDGEEIIFSLFGGEPFLNFKLIEHMVNTFKQYNRKFSLSIVTNMTILTDDILNFLIDDYSNEKYINIAISLDGNRDTHNKNRNNTFDLVMNNFYKLKSNNIHVGVSSVIDVNTLPYTFINFLYLLSLGITSFSFFLNFNNITLLDNKKNADILSFELDKICSYLRQSPSKIRVRLERLRLDQIDIREDILPCGGRVEYVNTDGTRFNCTRHKYANLKGRIEFKEYNKCKNCSVRVYCCSCFGNSSFLYQEGMQNFDNIDPTKVELYKANFCYLMNKYVSTVLYHYDLLKSATLNEELFLLNDTLIIKNPSHINTTDLNFFIAIEQKIKFSIPTNCDITAIIIIHRDNINDVINIINSLGTITRINFVFRNIHQFTQMDILILNNILKEVAKLNYTYIDIRDYCFIKNGVEYSDIDCTHQKTKEVNGNILCNNCTFICPLDFAYNKNITGEPTIPPINYCKIRELMYENKLLKIE